MGRCIVCGKALPQKPLITFDRMPASAQDLPNREQLETEKGISLSLYSCNGCGLVQFDCKPVSYYRDVIRSGGYSTTMVELRRKQYSHLIDKYNLTNKKFLEVGCGRGEFLSVLKEFPVETYGIENNAYLVQEAHDQSCQAY